MPVSSRRPYLIRAMVDWAVDNDLTPHLVVSATAPGVEVPAQHVSEGKITLNLGPRAVQGLVIGDDSIRFSARFGGQLRQVSFPPGAVLAVYARENGEGVVFGEVEAAAGQDSPPPEPPAAPQPRGAHLRVVK